MNIRTILSGITALLFVGVFYTFSFCVIEDVDDDAISIDYYYATEPTDEIPSDSNTPQNNAENKKPSPVQTVTNDLGEVVYIEPDPSFFEDFAFVTVVPDEAGNTSNVSPVSDASNNKKEDESDDITPNKPQYDDELLEEDEGVGSGSFAAEDQGVYAEDRLAENMLLSREDEELSEDDDLSDVPSIPAEEVVVTILDREQQTTAVSSKDINAGETFTVKINGSACTMDAYELVCLIVNNEISPSFSSEAIKAQAVAAYSYVKYHNDNGLTPSVLVRYNVGDTIKNLVAEVFGVTCYYNGSVAQTVYMASSSGYTSAASNVWGGELPYLQSVYCPFDVDDPNYAKVATYTESEIKNALERTLGITLSDNPENWLTVTSYIDGNYVSCLNVDGQVNITGRKMRETVLGYKLKSAAFDVSYSDGIFTFTTYGYGHGVGMSQNGANILAKQGYSYEQILKFYFTGIEVR